MFFEVALSGEWLPGWVVPGSPHPLGLIGASEDLKGAILGGISR